MLAPRIAPASRLAFGSGDSDPHFAGAPGRILTLAHGARPNSRSSRFRRTRESALVRQSPSGCRARSRQAAFLREKQYLSSPFVYRAYTSTKAAKPSSDQNCPRRLNLFWFCEHCDSMAPLPIGTPSAAFLS